LCSAVLFLVLAEHHPIGERWSDALLFYAFLPVLAVLLLLRRNPLDFGLRIGDWRLWCRYVVVTCLVAVPVLYAASRLNSLHSYYSVSDFDLAKYVAESVAYLCAWEFLFRGYLLFGLKDRFKEASILVQMVPFVLLHLGKPEIETISTIPMGIYLGFVAYRGNSFWPAAIIHLFINVLFRVYANWL
jgi:membrane protease YdiL (CAAX protease family)